MAHPCPQCHDRSTQKISLMCDSSTRRGTDNRGRAHSSQPELASEYSPPQPRGYFWRGLAVCSLTCFGSVLAKAVGQQLHMPLLGLALAWIVLGASAFWLVGSAKNYNAKI